MKVIYNRIDEDFMTLNEANDVLFEIDRINADGEIVELENHYDDDIESVCEKLNNEDVYGCGTCYYVVEDDITSAELRKVTGV